MAEQPLIGGYPDFRPFDLPPGCLPPQLPDQFAHLGNGLGRNGLTKAGQPAAGVDGDPAADGGVSVPEQALGLTVLAQPDVLVPVSRGPTTGRRPRPIDVLRTDAGFLVGSQSHRLLERGAD